jgi:hypothetical protein
MVSLALESVECKIGMVSVDFSSGHSVSQTTVFSLSSTQVERLSTSVGSKASDFLSSLIFVVFLEVLVGETIGGVPCGTDVVFFFAVPRVTVVQGTGEDEDDDCLGFEG